MRVVPARATEDGEANCGTCLHMGVLYGAMELSCTELALHVLARTDLTPSRPVYKKSLYEVLWPYNHYVDLCRSLQLHNGLLMLLLRAGGRRRHTYSHGLEPDIPEGFQDPMDIPPQHQADTGEGSGSGPRSAGEAGGGTSVGRRTKSRRAYTMMVKSQWTTHPVIWGTAWIIRIRIGLVTALLKLMRFGVCVFLILIF